MNDVFKLGSFEKHLSVMMCTQFQVYFALKWMCLELYHN
jgi:hypothetical protein